MFTSKLGYTIVSSADTIVISAFLGLTVLAQYQNYYYIMSSIIGFMSIIYASITAGVGNSMITKSVDQNYREYCVFSLLVSFVSGICGACFLCLYQPFMTLWMGENLLLPFSLVVLLCVYFWIYEYIMMASVYKDAGGIWHLYTVDLICHGSPSPIILEKYLAENYVDIKKIKDLNFRNKDGFGLRSGYKRISFDDGSDLYTFAFLTSLDYTENCYSCRYATLDRVSDITLGDSWGSELEAEEQKKGISLILCQTEKGKELLKNTKIELRDVNLNKAVEANHQLSYPSKMPTERKIFFKNIDKGFNYAISRCHPKMYYIRRLKYILHKAKIIRGGQQR